MPGVWPLGRMRASIRRTPGRNRGLWGQTPSRGQFEIFKIFEKNSISGFSTSLPFSTSPSIVDLVNKHILFPRDFLKKL